MGIASCRLRHQRMWRSHTTVLLDSCGNRGPRRQARTSARRRRRSRLGSALDQPLPIPNLSSSSRTARHCGSLSHDACGRARPCHRMGSVLAVLARGGLFYEEGPRAVVPRAGYQGGDRCRRDSLGPLGCLPGARPQHGPVARWPRARPLLSRAGVRDLGARAHRAQLGHPDDAEGRAGPGGRGRW